MSIFRLEEYLSGAAGAHPVILFRLGGSFAELRGKTCQQDDRMKFLQTPSCACARVRACARARSIYRSRKGGECFFLR